MQRSSFIKMTKLPNVKGRIYYISSAAKQENLYAVYETTERKFWSELQKCNQAEFAKSGTEGRCIEARELIIALPEVFTEYDPQALLKLFTEHFKQNYETECIAALHHNKRKTNYHIHLIFSERKLLEEPIEKIAARNMFYNEQGKHVRTKKEILDADGKIKEGCTIVLKGQVYEKNLFAKKNPMFKSEAFLDAVKKSYTDLINLYVKDEKDRLKVFDRNGVYLPMKKIGKNNPKGELIKADNVVRTEWNLTVDRALIGGVPETQIMDIKQTKITKMVKQSFQTNGNRPELFRLFVEMAIQTLDIIIKKVLSVIKPKEPEEMKPSQVEVPKLPKQSELAAKYQGLKRVHDELSHQNYLIEEVKTDIGNLEKELANMKGLLKGKQRRETNSQIDELKERLSILQRSLPAIAKNNGFQSVREFTTAYQAAAAAYQSYQKQVKEYNQRVKPKPEKQSIHERLEQSKQAVKERKRAEIQKPRRKKSWDRDER